MRIPTVHHAELASPPMEVCVPAGHRLAAQARLEPAELDGETLLCASPPGTPYTDMVLSTLREGGATLTALEARVTGGSAMLAEIAGLEAIAVVPQGTPVPAGVVRLPVEGFVLPLLALWPAGLPPLGIDRVRTAFSA